MSRRDDTDLGVVGATLEAALLSMFGVDGYDELRSMPGLPEDSWPLHVTGIEVKPLGVLEVRTDLDRQPWADATAKQCGRIIMAIAAQNAIELKVIRVVDARGRRRARAVRSDVPYRAPRPPS